MPKKTKKSPIKKIKTPTTFSDEPKGLVICYLGAGKGKTTAAMGMAIRAAGAGMNVCILQFVKAKGASKENIKEGEWPVSSEIDFLNNLNTSSKVGRIDNEQMGAGFVGILGDKKEKEIHVRAALEGLGRAREVIASGKYQLVILDEIISALESKLLEERDILDIIDLKAPLQHLVITGHNKFPKILDKCDLVTEMCMIKHPYYKGILAQRGIDY
ncbi:MAG: cob(I)yrinic acid a,c-diamide adenosyltransferase [Candidatus Doudnabacteria bacterium]|nr:cob(I)yrinic acid a,c-diamide adenosyltransferase [Candidatus Doudnabacteria bacterium]